MDINITKQITNETLTEDLIIEWLNSEEFANAPNSTKKFARQYPLGNRRVDFLTYYTKTTPPTCILIEAKYLKLENGETQVKEYMDLVCNTNTNITVIGIAASLNNDVLKLSAFSRKGNGEYIKLKITENVTLDFLVSQTLKEVEGISTSKKKIMSWKDKLQVELAQLHEYVRNYCKAPANEKINLLNGVFIALRSEDFKRNMNKYQDLNYNRNIYNAIISVMMSVSHDMEQIQQIKNSFAFLDIDTHPTNDAIVPAELLNNPSLTGLLSFNKFVSNYIYYKIIKPLEDSPEVQEIATDIASVVYNEFLRYAKGDAKDLGIVLTPEHICDLMSDLLELKPEDKVLDICSGSGALLISSMKKKIANSSTGKEENNSLNGLIGIELQPHMYALSMANLLFNGADTSNLYLGSCYESKIIEKIKELQPTKAILNPPYAMYKNSDCEENLNELGFVLHAINFLPIGAKCAAIIPTSCGIKGGVFEKYRQLILKNNRLDAIVECNPKLFEPSATVATSIYLFTIGTPHNKSTSIYSNCKIDGFKSSKRGYSVDLSTWFPLKNQIVKDIINDECSSISKIFKIKLEDNWDYLEYLNLTLSKENLKDAIVNYNNVINPKIRNNNIIDISKWKEYKITDLFEIIKGKGLVSKNGTYNQITASAFNNGIGGKSNTYITENALTVASNGKPGVSFYQKEKFNATTDVNILIPKFNFLTFHIGIFISTIITKTLIPKYNYGKKLGLERIINESILLPTKDNLPDWEYIENYMNSLYDNELTDTNTTTNLHTFQNGNIT